MKEHLDAEGKPIKEGDKVWAAVGHNMLGDGTVIKLCQTTIRVQYRWKHYNTITKLLYPESVVVRTA